VYVENLLPSLKIEDKAGRIPSTIRCCLQLGYRLTQKYEAKSKMFSRTKHSSLLILKDNLEKSTLMTWDQCYITFLSVIYEFSYLPGTNGLAYYKNYRSKMFYHSGP
jgi:hypothetical protein